MNVVLTEYFQYILGILKKMCLYLPGSWMRAVVSALKHVILVPCIWSVETKGLIYFINPIAPRCNLARCQRLVVWDSVGVFVPFFLHCICCWEIHGPALPPRLAAPACLPHAVVWHSAAGWALWPGGCISSHYACSSSLLLTVGWWCWSDPDLSVWSTSPHHSEAVAMHDSERRERWRTVKAAAWQTGRAVQDEDAIRVFIVLPIRIDDTHFAFLSSKDHFKCRCEWKWLGYN